MSRRQKGTGRLVAKTPHSPRPGKKKTKWVAASHFSLRKLTCFSLPSVKSTWFQGHFQPLAQIQREVDSSHKDSNQEKSYAVKFLFNQERADKISVWGPDSQCPGMRLLKPGTGHQIFQGRIPGSSNEHLETDVLGSLEKLQTLGTMRSIRCVASASASASA